MKSMIESAVSSQYGPPIKVKVYQHGQLFASDSKRSTKRLKRRKNIGKIISSKKIGLMPFQQSRYQPMIMLLMDKDANAGGYGKPMSVNQSSLSGAKALQFLESEVQFPKDAEKQLSHTQLQSIRKVLKILEAHESTRPFDFNMHDHLEKDITDREGMVFIIGVANLQI